ncbi:MAG: histidine kinase [Planctomycetota bacterium]|nr:MAG: histidine kinase [Planctomycetota bacterium]REK20642.1 MAG: histidine kinase [Planctomycetota bacterium]REK34959.1 MAG: histidine kinase [Planctomycetota bacterium]
MKQPTSGGGWKAVAYTLSVANRVGWTKLWKAMRSRNTCKTCALGMGGQLGGMVNEGGHFPEVCKKSFQAMASDMQPAIPPEFFARHGFNELRALSPRQLEASGRLVAPLFAGPDDSHYRPIEWEEALNLLADRLKAAGPTRSFFYASGRSSNEAGFLLQLLARLFGTNYVNNCSYYCHQASGVGLGSSIGTGTGTIQLDDLDHADLYILIGANPASNHPRLMRSLMQLRRRGGRVVVVNPAKELGLVNFRVPSDVRSLLFGSEIASLYVQPHIGGDIALLTGVAKEVLSRGAQDDAFIRESTNGFEEFARQVEETAWDDIEQGSGVARDVILRIADQYIDANNVVIGWAMGITHHRHGCDNVRMIANLALLRGMVGRPHAGLMPIRGHSNVQGMGSIGVTPTLKKAILERYEQKLGIAAPASPGLDTMACMEAAGKNEMDTAVCLGGNLYGSNPEAPFAERALSQIGCVAYLATTLNTGHAWGRGRETLILPVLPRDEEPQSTTQESMFSFVRLSDGGAPRHAGPRSEVSVLTALGRRLFGENGPVDWNELESHDAIRQLIADLIPGYEPIAELGRSGKEFHIPGRHVAQPEFSTPDGKARFHAVKLPPSNGTAENQFRLMTIRSEGQFNTVVYEDHDLYRGQDRRDVVLLHPDDLQRLGLQPDQTVRVHNSTGEMRWQRVRPFDIRPGNAMMYCPEANALLPRDVDPESKTPAFKHALVSIDPEN